MRTLAVLAALTVPAFAWAFAPMQNISTIVAPTTGATVAPDQILVSWQLAPWEPERRGGVQYWIGVGDGKEAETWGTVQLLHHINADHGETVVSATGHPNLRPGSRAVLVILRADASVAGQLKAGQLLQVPKGRAGLHLRVWLSRRITFADSAGSSERRY